LEVYNILIIPSLLYSCEVWISKEENRKLKRARDEIHGTKQDSIYRPQKT
jgi:hypothetical protein